MKTNPLEDSNFGEKLLIVNLISSKLDATSKRLHVSPKFKFTIFTEAITIPIPPPYPKLLTYAP